MMYPDYDADQADERDPGGTGAITLKCIGIKADGAPCEALPQPDSDYCYNHDPQLAKVRSLNGIRGNRIAGRGRPSLTQEYVHIREKIQALTEQVLDGTLDPRIANAVTGLLNAYLRAMQQQREAEQDDEIQTRLDLIEEVLEGGNQRWATGY